MLVYPRDPDDPGSSSIEDGNPWHFDDETHLRFVALPLDEAAASAHCAGIIADMTKQ
jgi:hypothetical protein